MAPHRADSQLAVIQLYGWQVRQRGEGWGKRKACKRRLEWHELKTGVFYLKELNDARIVSRSYLLRINLPRLKEAGKACLNCEQTCPDMG